MTAGLPGVGLAGIFYVISALVMPLVAVYRVVTGRGHRARWGLVVQQFALAVALLAAFAGSGLVARAMTPEPLQDDIAKVLVNTRQGDELLGLSTLSPLVWTLAILAVVVALVLVSAVAGRPRTRGRHVRTGVLPLLPPTALTGDAPAAVPAPATGLVPVQRPRPTSNGGPVTSWGTRHDA